MCRREEGGHRETRGRARKRGRVAINEGSDEKEEEGQVVKQSPKRGSKLLNASCKTDVSYLNCVINLVYMICSVNEVVLQKANILHISLTLLSHPKV